MGFSHRCAGCEPGPRPHGRAGDLLGKDGAAALSAAALALISSEDVSELLRTLPPGVRRDFLKPLNLQNTKKISAHTAETVLRALRGGDHQRKEALRTLLASGATHALSNADGLTAADCAELLVPETAPQVLARSYWTALSPCWTLPPRVLRWTLAHAIEQDLPLAVVALGLLAGERDDPAEPPLIDRDCWARVRDDHPDLPERPIGATALAALALSLPVPTASDETTTDEKADQAVDTPTAEQGGPQPVLGDLEQVTEALGLLRERFLTAAQAADRIAEELRVGRRPADTDLGEVHEAIADFDRLRAQITSVTGGGASDDELSTLDRAVGAIRESERADARIRALAGLRGPDFLADELAEVRRMSRSSESGRLAALAELLEAVTEGDKKRAVLLSPQARAELPPELTGVVDMALSNDLEIGSTEGFEHAADQTGRPEPKERSTGTGEIDAGNAANEVCGAVKTEEPQVGEPEAEQSEQNEEAEGLAALDVFLEANALGTKSVRTVPGSSDPVEQDDPQRVTAQEPPAESKPQRDGERPEYVTAHRLEDDDALPAELAEAEAAALRTGRFGLAGWLREAAGRPAAESNARRCAALARAMAVFAGALSGEFTAAARDLDAKALAADPAGRLLAWSAAIRAGLVHPTPESTRLVECLNVVVSAHPVLKECGEAFNQAARAGVYLSPGVEGWIRGAAGAAEARRAAAAEAARLLDEEPRRKIKYQHATEVWKDLVQPSGSIGALLALAAQDDPARADELAAEVVRLRGTAEINRLIDETDARISARKKGKGIIASARSQLVTKIDTALEAVGAWAAAAKEPGETGSEVQDWRVGPLRQLRDLVGGRRAEIDDALRAFASDPDPLLVAAAGAARMLLAEALDLLDGVVLPPNEPPAAHLLHQDLLLVPGLPLGPRDLEPSEMPDPATLAAVALAEAPDWEAAFEARAGEDDHEGTLGIVTVLQTADPETAARLRDRRDELVRAARAARDRRVEEIRDLVARWQRDGVLTEDQARRAEENLRTLAGDRHDFDRVNAALDVLRENLERQRRTAIDEARALLNERAGDLAEPDVGRIGERIDNGDLTTAREFLAQLEAGNRLAEGSTDIDHFRQFYPAFPETFHRQALRAGSRARKQESSEFIDVLKVALNNGSEVTDPELEGLLAGIGVHVPTLRNASRQIGSEGLRQWGTCGHGPKSSGNLRSSIDAILKMVGLEGRQSQAQSEHGRMWIDLDEVHYVGDAQLPAFGTRMSPSGDRLRLLMVWGRPGPQQLLEHLKGQPEDQTVLIFYFGLLSADDRRLLAQVTRNRPDPVAGVLDDAAMAYLACHSEDWAVTVRLMAPFTATNPYAPVGDVPDEMFYGRAAQLREVTDRNGPSFVYGGRQLGKSALLRKAERTIRAERNVLDVEHPRTVILENIQMVGKVPANSLWPLLADRLAQAGVVRPGVTRRDQVVEAVKEWAAADPHRQLLILLDEADHFLNQDAAQGRFEDVTALRNLMFDTGRRVKVVWAGLHQTARFQSLPNQPLAHLGTPIAVGPLEPQNAFDLLVRPLAALGFTFPETLAARVIAEANNAPALVQLFADELLKRLRRDTRTVRELPYEITSDDVAAVWRDKKLARGFRDRFEWTLNLDKRYKVIAYTVALHALDRGAEATLTVGELWAQCRDWWAPGFDGCTSDGFRGLLDECVNLGVLGVDDDGYRLRTPHILNLLGGVQDVEEVLENAGEFELPDAFDAHSYHAAYCGGPERSPLSSHQLARLLRPGRLVHIVVGSRALHAERVARALKEEETSRDNLKIWQVRQGGMTFEGALSRTGQNNGHGVIVLDLSDQKDAARFERRLAEATAAVEAHRHGTLAVVLVVGPWLASSWVRAAAHDDAELVELRRFDQPAVRQWMWEDSQGFPDERGQRMLLKHTGGWPTLVGQVVSRIAEHGKDRDQALEHCQAQIEQNPRALLQDAGVEADPCLATAWRILVREDAPETAEDLAALLALHAEETAPLLGPGALAAQGYAGTGDVVEALRVLGALAPVDGKLACEPVLAAATRRSEVT